MIEDLQTCEPGRRAEAAIDVITTDRSKWRRTNRRPVAITAREALIAMHFEALLVWTAAQNVAAGIELSDEDRGRLTLAARRVMTICDEVIR